MDGKNNNFSVWGVISCDTFTGACFIMMFCSGAGRTILQSLHKKAFVDTQRFTEEDLGQAWEKELWEEEGFYVLREEKSKYQE